MTLVLGSLDKIRCSADEGLFGRMSDDSIGPTTLATSRVVKGIPHVLIHGKGLASNGRLVNSNKRLVAVACQREDRISTRTTTRAAAFLFIVFTTFSSFFGGCFFILLVTVAKLILGRQLPVDQKIFGPFAVADQA